MLLNIIVLIFEVLYYSLFMTFAKKEGKLYRYCILFTIVSLLVSLANVKQLPIYITFILLTYIGLKYIVKAKVSFYDILIIVIMLLTNLIIEFPIYLIVFKLLKANRFITTIIFDIIKVTLVCVFNTLIYEAFRKLKLLWNNNNFYIRYISSVIVYVYVIVTIYLLILYR